MRYRSVWFSRRTYQLGHALFSLELLRHVDAPVGKVGGEVIVQLGIVTEIAVDIYSDIIDR